MILRNRLVSMFGDDVDVLFRCIAMLGPYAEDMVCDFFDIHVGDDDSDQYQIAQSLLEAQRQLKGIR